MNEQLLNLLADIITREQREQWIKSGYTHDEDPARPGCAWVAKVKPGKKYTKIDVGGSGKYMVDNATGEIFGIKAYGVIHRGHQYGTLETIHDWKWGGYTAARKTKEPLSGNHNANCDGSGPCAAGEVRKLPLGSIPDHGNVILCRNCFNREIAFREERNKELAEDCKFKLPAWASLEVYQ